MDLSHVCIPPHAHSNSNPCRGVPPALIRQVGMWYLGSLLSFHPVKIDTSSSMDSKRSQLSRGAKTHEQAGSLMHGTDKEKTS